MTSHTASYRPPLRRFIRSSPSSPPFFYSIYPEEKTNNFCSLHRIVSSRSISRIKKIRSFIFRIYVAWYTRAGGAVLDFLQKLSLAFKLFACDVHVLIIRMVDTGDFNARKDTVVERLEMAAGQSRLFSAILIDPPSLDHRQTALISRISLPFPSLEFLQIISYIRRLAKILLN